jgi:hypothetical protein
MEVAISAVASDMGNENSHGTTMRNKSDIPGPEREIMSSNPNGPAAQ